ncbi:MAG: lactate utilization protein [Candidatus Ventricola sp.]
MNEKLESVACALRARGFEADVFDTAQDAARALLSELPAAQTVGIGGSVTVRQMELDRQLADAGHTVLWHWTAQDKSAARHQSLSADCYVCSANALTEDGLIVQIDGTGNRTAAMCYGPGMVYLLVGRNKLVSGGYPQAVRRIKQVACPKNAERLGRDTPCRSGACNVQACRQSMCSIFLALERAPGGKRTRVLLIDEELGY